MASITIRNLSAESKARLRQRAEQRGCSLEALVRSILDDAAEQARADGQVPARPNRAALSQAKTSTPFISEHRQPQGAGRASVILVDTNVLSELTRPTPQPRVIAWLEVNEPALALPTIALAELRYGIVRLPDGRRRSGLLHFWHATCEQFRGRTLLVRRTRRRAVRRRGRRRGTRGATACNIQDGQIAAIALVHGMSVATRNVGDFQATGVAIVNPWD